MRELFSVRVVIERRMFRATRCQGGDARPQSFPQATVMRFRGFTRPVGWVRVRVFD